MLDEVDNLRRQYARAIDDGKKISAFTTMPEWNWYVDFVVKPTIDDYINRIMTGTIATDKEDWILRGMVMGMKLVTETTESFERTADEAKKKGALLEKQVEEADES